MKKLLLFIIYVFITHNAEAQKNKISINKTPNWVSSINNLQLDNRRTTDNSGFYYHLIDSQANLDKKTFFYHYTIELTNNEGIQQISDINIDFDPSYQKLIFHSINILRNGTTINKLSLNQIKTAQREADMERFLYDGTLTAFINLTDVRIGDVLDYSYSIVGSNPIYENKYHGRIQFQYSIPVGLLYNRILVPENRKLNFKYFHNASNALQTNYQGLTEYIWKNKNLDPIVYDVNTPSWYNPISRVSISEYSSWSEVVDQYKKHYQLSEKDLNKLRKNALELFSNMQEDSLVNNIRKFVQDDVRYLGFEGGLNSHKPDNPINVLNQRYGDCKAKSFLLSELYKTFNIEAYPILVNTYNGKNIEDELPSPNMFDHCIVQVKLDKEQFFIDPTISNQGGSLDNLYTPAYIKGLVLRDNEIALTNIKSTAESGIRILEEFDMDSIGGKGNLRVTTKYLGSNADHERVNFAKKDIQKIQQDYLNFYSAIYPSIKESSTLEIIDHRNNRNEFIIKENYTIDSLWLKSPEDEKIIFCEFYPLTIENYVNLNKSPQRTMPYHVYYPTDVEHQIIVNLPEEWSIQQENKVVQDDSFVYAYDIYYTSKQLKLTHSYKTLQNHVTADKTSSFISKHEQILNGLSYMLTYNRNFINQDDTGLSFILILIALIIIGGSVYFAVKLYKNYDLKVTIPSTQHSQIGGWLVIVAIGLSLTPLILFYDLISNFQNFFGISTWNYITQDHSTFNELFYSLLIIFELIYNSIFIVFSVLLIFLFFNRRTITPRMMIIFYAATFIMITLDTSIAFSIQADLYSEAEKVQTFKEISKSFIRAVIWIPYFLISKRVKSTFIQTYNKNESF